MEEIQMDVIPVEIPCELTDSLVKTFLDKKGVSVQECAEMGLTHIHIAKIVLEQLLLDHFVRKTLVYKNQQELVVPSMTPSLN